MEQPEAEAVVLMVEDLVLSRQMKVSEVLVAVIEEHLNYLSVFLCQTFLNLGSCLYWTKLNK